MFDYDPPKEETRTDWSGTIIGLSLLPVFFFFVWLGKPDMGFTLVIVLGVALFSIKLHWKLRKRLGFWATIVFILALHIPLLFVVRWPEGKVPTRAYSLPLGIVDFLLIMGAISLAKRIFSNGSTAGEEIE